MGLKLFCSVYWSLQFSPFIICSYSDCLLSRCWFPVVVGCVTRSDAEPLSVAHAAAVSPCLWLLYSAGLSGAHWGLEALNFNMFKLLIFSCVVYAFCLVKKLFPIHKIFPTSTVSFNDRSFNKQSVVEFCFKQKKCLFL